MNRAGFITDVGESVWHYLWRLRRRQLLGVAALAVGAAVVLSASTEGVWMIVLPVAGVYAWYLMIQKGTNRRFIAEFAAANNLYYAFG